MIAVANFISLPLLFLSTTFLARAQMPHWMRVGARFNPVNWGVNAARAVVLPATDWGAVGVYLALLLALTAATAALATWAFRSYRNTL
jgi:ABC-2 type transport system permease protein